MTDFEKMKNYMTNNGHTFKYGEKSIMNIDGGYQLDLDEMDIPSDALDEIEENGGRRDSYIISTFEMNDQATLFALKDIDDDEVVAVLKTDSSGKMKAY